MARRIQVRRSAGGAGVIPCDLERVQEKVIDLIGHVVRTVRRPEAARSERAGTPTSLDGRRSARNAPSAFRPSTMARVPPMPPIAPAPRSRPRTASASAASSVRRDTVPPGSAGSRPGQPGRRPDHSRPLSGAIRGPSTGGRPSLSCSPWHDWHFATINGRIDFSKNSIAVASSAFTVNAWNASWSAPTTTSHRQAGRGKARREPDREIPLMTIIPTDRIRRKTAMRLTAPLSLAAEPGCDRSRPGGFAVKQMLEILFRLQ